MLAGSDPGDRCVPALLDELFPHTANKSSEPRGAPTGAGSLACRLWGLEKLPTTASWSLR
jgi:hypothetical protein